MDNDMTRKKYGLRSVQSGKTDVEHYADALEFHASLIHKEESQKGVAYLPQLKVATNRVHLS